MNKSQTAPASGMRSVLVVDDHPLYCDALVTTLTRIFAPDRIETTACLADALAVTFRPDLIMLDLKLPDVEGLSGFIRLRDLMPDVPIVVISAEISDAQLADIMALGGSGYVSKNASQAEFREALEKVQQGQHSFPERIKDYQRSAPPSADRQELLRRLADLTPQQTRILRLISDGKPNKQIAYEMSLAEATVKAHVTALLRRLGVRNRTQAALMVTGQALDALTETGGAAPPQPPLSRSQDGLG